MMQENKVSFQVIIKDSVDGGCGREVAPFLCTLYKPVWFLMCLSFFGLAKEDADMLDVRVKAVMFCSNG